MLGPGHAAVRFTHPCSGGDIMPTLRAEFHRLREGASTATRRETGSSVVQVFEGSGTVTVGDRQWTVERGDLFVVPAWQPLTVSAETQLDLFRFSDTPVMERLALYREQVDHQIEVTT